MTKQEEFIQCHIPESVRNDDRFPGFMNSIGPVELPTWLQWQNYCGDLYEKEVNDGLQKHRERNEQFLLQAGHVETFGFMVEYNRSLPDAVDRKVVGEEYMKAHLHVMASYNTVMGQMSLDDFDEDRQEMVLNSLRKVQKAQLILFKLPNEI